MTKILKGVVIGVVAAFSATSAALAVHPAVYTHWRALDKVSLDACLARAEAIIKSQGLENKSPTQTTRYGVRGDFVYGIRCIAEKNVVVFFGAGPNFAQLKKVIDAIHRTF
jgi:hypothetical protein